MATTSPSATPGPSDSTPSLAQLGFIVLPGVPISPNGLQTNDDGQWSIITRTEISIFTAKYGLETDKGIFNQQVVRKAPNEDGALGDTNKGKHKADERSELSWTKTSLVIDKKNITKWDTFSNEFDFGNPLARGNHNEAYWRDITWSPTGLGPLGGCVLAALSTNHEVQVYQPIKNPTSAAWAEVYDMTSHLVRLLIIDKAAPNPVADGQEKPFETFQTKKEASIKLQECQTTSLAWSPPVDGSLGDFSLLVLGHKSGHVSLWRRWSGGKMEILHRYRMDDRAQWITQLSWSPWMMFNDGGRRFAMASLAVADSAGSVWSLEITQEVTAPRLALQIGTNGIDVDADASGISAAQPLPIGVQDRRPVEQFKWITTQFGRKLVYTKVGIVYVANLQRPMGPSATVFALASLDQVELPTTGAEAWMGATSYAPCAGIEYLPARDSLVIILTSACTYSISLSPYPALASASADLPDSAELTARFRKAFVDSTKLRGYEGTTAKQEIPKGKLGSKSGARVTGLAGFGPGGELGWLYEFQRPDAITYRTNFNIKTTFILSSIEHQPNLQTHLSHLQALLAAPPNVRLKAPLGLLRSLLHFLHDRAHAASVVNGVLDVLAELPPAPEPLKEGVAPEPEAVATAFLVRLFGDSYLEGLRLRETVARFIVRHAKLPRSAAGRAAAVHALIAREIGRVVTTRLALILNSAQPIFSPAELEVSGRVLLASASLQLPETADELPEDPNALPSSFKSAETCPACQAEIPFDNLRKATCARGHTWDRCSVTLAVVETIYTRTCMGCQRKALLEVPAKEREKQTAPEAHPLPQAPPLEGATEGGGEGEVPMEVEGERDGAGVVESQKEEGGVVMNGMLRAATCCLHCGGRWMRIHV